MQVSLTPEFMFSPCIHTFYLEFFAASSLATMQDVAGVSHWACQLVADGLLK